MDSFKVKFTLQCGAVSFIEKLTADSLGLTQVEFDRYMSGEALPPNAISNGYMCEGMRMVKENILQLEEMEKSVNKLIDDYENIMENVETLNVRRVKLM